MIKQMYRHKFLLTIYCILTIRMQEIIVCYSVSVINTNSKSYSYLGKKNV